MPKKKVTVWIDYDTSTTFIQNKKTGRMQGRRRVRGLGDRTAVRRVRRDFNGFKEGQILGRTTRISKKKLAQVKPHKRRSKKGKPVRVRKHKRKLR